MSAQPAASVAVRRDVACTRASAYKKDDFALPNVYSSPRRVVRISSNLRRLRDSAGSLLFWRVVCTFSWRRCPSIPNHRNSELSVIMSRQATDWRKDSVPAELEELRGYLNQLPLPWREKMLPLCERASQYIRLQYKLLRMSQDMVEQLQLDVKYLMFDVEATRRERDELIREFGVDGFGEAETE
jgi:hypothetical protein